MIELQSKVKDENPLIIAVSEVKLKNSNKTFQDKDFTIPNYNFHSINLDNNTRRGIVVYTYSSIKKSVTHITLVENFDEVYALEVRLRNPTTTVNSSKNNEKLLRLFQKFGKLKYSHTCILGDFNFRGIQSGFWVN